MGRIVLTSSRKHIHIEHGDILWEPSWFYTQSYVKTMDLVIRTHSSPNPENMSTRDSEPCLQFGCYATSFHLSRVDGGRVAERSSLKIHLSETGCEGAESTSSFSTGSVVLTITSAASCPIRQGRYSSLLLSKRDILAFGEVMESYSRSSTREAG